MKNKKNIDAMYSLVLGIGFCIIMVDIFFPELLFGRNNIILVILIICLVTVGILKHGTNHNKDS